MNGLAVKTYQIERNLIPRRLARDIYSCGIRGKIAVIAKDPNALLCETHAQWLKLLRQEESQHLAGVSRADGELLKMRSLSFSDIAPDDLLEADITFATADDFVRVPPICYCVYVTYNIEREKLHMLTAWMPRNGLVVIYE